MSFGRRDRQSWQTAQEDLEGIQDLMLEENDGPVRTALEEVRQGKLLNEFLAPVQLDLWYRLFNAFEIGGVDLIRINFKLSGMEVEDLLDLLYVANALADYGGSAEYENFQEALFGYLQTLAGPRMDALLAEYFSRYPSTVEQQLIRLVSSEELIRSRMYDLLDMECDYLTQTVLSEGVIKLLQKEEEDGDEKNPMVYIDDEDALKFLQRLMLDETILDDGFVPLIKKIPSNSPVLFVLMDKIIEWMNKPYAKFNYISGFESIGAAVVGKLSTPGLVATINSQAEGLADERLLALSRIKAPTQISDAALIDILMEKEVKEARDNSAEKRQQLRQMILAKKEFRPRLMKLGIIGIFQQTSFQA